MNTTARHPHRGWALTALALLAIAAPSAALPYPTTRRDFELPGTQPLTVTANFAPPSSCTPCHSNYGQPNVEPYRAWQGSMMAHSGRDPLMLAALTIANQDLEHAGETCLRCRYPKGWLEGRSAPEDGTAMTADDRQGVQCSICHRLVDPVADSENPLEDGAILAALLQPVPTFGSAMMVVDPQDRLRGPFDIIGDLGSDPHLPLRSTLISPFHESAELCGTCHNVRNTAFTRNLLGEYELNALDTPGDPTAGFPEQSTSDEWAASTYASTGVYAPQFGRNQDTVSNCQSCHMPDVTGKDANLGLTRDDVPLHELVGGNTFIPTILPYHPAFGAEVNPAIMQESIDKSTRILRQAATVTLDLTGGILSVRVTNESGHSLPTRRPQGCQVQNRDRARARALSEELFQGVGQVLRRRGPGPDLRRCDAGRAPCRRRGQVAREDRRPEGSRLQRTEHQPDHARPRQQLSGPLRDHGALRHERRGGVRGVHGRSRRARDLERRLRLPSTGGSGDPREQRPRMSENARQGGERAHGRLDARARQL